MAHRLTPEEYLRELQKKLTPPGRESFWEPQSANAIINILRAQREQEVAEASNRFNLQEILRGMKKAEEKIDALGPFMAFEADLRRLAEKIITIMEVNEQKKFDNCVVGVLPTGDPNACAIAMPDDGTIVAVDFGLVPTLYQMTEVIVSTIGVNIRGQPLQKSKLDVKDAAENLYKISQYYTHALARPQPSRSWPWSFESVALASALTRLQELFVLAHEFGHILAGHLDEYYTSRLDMLEDTVSVSMVTRDHAQEFEADVRGFHITKRVVEKYGSALTGVDVQELVPAMGILFVYFALFERLGFIPRVTQSHPSARDRLAQIRKIAGLTVSVKGTELLNWAERLCEIVHHPIVTIHPAKGKEKPITSDAIRVDEGFYLPGEIVANRHSICLLSVLLRHLHIFGLHTDPIPDVDWHLLEPKWREVAEESGRQNLVWADSVATELQRRGFSLTQQDVLTAHVDSLVEYNWQWWPFYKYVQPFVQVDPPVFLPVEFGDDPSEIGHLPKEEGIPVLSQEDLKYNWKLNRNLGIQRVMRVGAKESSAILVSDTPMKFQVRWAPGVPTSHRGRPIALLLAEWKLPAIPTLDPIETIEMRTATRHEAENFWVSLRALYKAINDVKEDTSSEDVLWYLKRVSSQFRKSTQPTMADIESTISSRYPDRKPRRVIGQLVIGPLASSPVLPPLRDNELGIIESLETLDTQWFLKLWSSCGLSFVCVYNNGEDWPHRRITSSIT